MKICTNIEQSKKLIELGIDVNSADMYWSIDEIPFLAFPVNDIVTDWKYAEENGMLPAWSLAALLEIIRNNGRYELQMYEGGYYFESNGFMTESYFNPIDACVAMIEKLHEQNLL